MGSSAEPRQPIRTLKYKPGYASELIGRCKYFEVERVLINTERVRNMAGIQTGSESFNVLLCIDGCADLFGEATLINIFRGDCVFIPADSVPLRLHGKAEFFEDQVLIKLNISTAMVVLKTGRTDRRNWEKYLQKRNTVFC